MSRRPNPLHTGISACALAFVLSTSNASQAQDFTHPAEAPVETLADQEGEIVVTAQKREERLQDVPIAISALGSEQLSQRGATDLSALAGAVPGLQIAGFGGANASNTVAIRGIAGQQLAIGSGFPTAIYLDGVYLSRPDQAFFGLDDVERIEVLRGPQGTLYGRNATAGAINIITRNPGATLRGGGELSYGAFNTISARGSLSGPVGAGFSLGVSGSYDRHDGYVTNTTTSNRLHDRESFTLRGKLGYATEDERFSAILAFDYTRSQMTPVFKNLVNPATGILERFGNPDDYTADAIGESLSRTEAVSKGASLTLNYEVSKSLSIVSITAGRYTRILTNFDGDASVAAAALLSSQNKVKTFNQEVRANFTGSSIRATGGVNIFTESAKFGLSVLPPTTAPIYGNPFDESHLTAWALFGQVEFDLSPRITLVGGLRYNNESRDYSVDYSSAPIFGNFTSGSIKDEVFVPSAGINFKLNRDVLLYAKYSEGYQAPGFTYSPGRTSTGDISFGAEKLRAYEVGAKTQFLDRRVTVNAAAFLYNYSDMQIRSTTGIGISRVSNAGSAKLKGFELATHIVLPAGFTLDAQVTYLDARYSSFCQPISGGDPQAGDPLCSLGIADRSGNRLNLAPEWSGGIGLAYKGEIGTAGTLSASVNLDFASTMFYLSSANEPGLDTGAWTTLASRVGFKLRNGPEIFAFGKNLTNDRYANTIQRASPGIVVATFNDPRTYGVGIGYRF